MIHHFSVGQIMRHLSPGTACSQQVQDAVDNLASRNGFAGRVRSWLWDERSQNLPLGIGHLRGIRLSGKLIGHLT
jgi:hypothetical protein